MNTNLNHNKVHDIVCIFIASSDNTKDVLKNVMASYEKFWGGCRYRKYVGLNSLDDEIADRFAIVTAHPSGWRSELLDQIHILPAEISHILLMLDDFLLLSPVDDTRLDSLIERSLSQRYDYLRLVPVSSALVFRLCRWLINKLSGDEFDTIPRGQPYYSSLQPTLWSREHLMSMLQLPGSIWEFETQSISGVKHYAIKSCPPIICRHVVEKGKWMADAAFKFKKMTLPFTQGKRYQMPSASIPLLWLRHVKFALFGYAGIRVRRILSSVSMHCKTVSQKNKF